MSTPILEVQDLSVYYGQVEAVHGASLQVHPGQIVTVIGANGAGKTSLLAAIMGLLPSRGTVTLEGVPHRHRSAEQMVDQGVGLVPERRELFAGLSVADNLLLGAFSRIRTGDRTYPATRERVLEIFPRLRERGTQLAGTLSGGERQMLALGRALMAQPKLLMLDEPSLGLAPRVVREIFRVIAQLRQTGVAILLVEQNARAALQIADQGYVLETGRVVLGGPAGELLQDPRVTASYLGSGPRDGGAGAERGPDLA